MAINELQKQTNVNVQEKANLIWEITSHLYGEYNQNHSLKKNRKVSKNSTKLKGKKCFFKGASLLTDGKGKYILLPGSVLRKWNG